MGLAMLPLRYRLYGARPADGIPLYWVEAYNRTTVRTYGRLHVKREDDRYCESLPCVAAMAAPAPAPATASHSGGLGGSASAARAEMPRVRANISVCSSMDECFAGDGGRYFYQPQPSARIR